MRSIGDWWDAGAAAREADLTDKQRQYRDEFIELVGMWAEGDIETTSLSKLIPPYIQAQVFRTIRRDHPQWADVMAFFDAAVAISGPEGVQTKHGFFTRQEIERYGGRISESINEYTDEVERVVEFPTGYGMGIDGKPDHSIPIYGAKPVSTHREEPFEWIEPIGKREWSAKDTTVEQGQENEHEY